MDLLVDTVDGGPLGPISLAAGPGALAALDFCAPAALEAGLRLALGPALRVRAGRDPLGLAARLRAYLAGDLEALAGVPVEPARPGGGTPFQRRVWATLREIPAGATLSYGALAARLGVPGAARAVGLANGRNPIAIAVPCHRVVGAGGALTGYAGGLERKRWLLDHERVFAASRPAAEGACALRI
jgi:methylated-DNA-[protein]-cysteine S-methyltransferase